ncbi:MAG: DNA-directed RNA polymerase subunit H [Candidatus Micrarchaeota archaeon]|nr:DNA-directed RNA polymerase subunit H [Candidatus Micrarchaeota archaeon]
MSRNDINSVLSTLGITVGNLPKILVSDPQAKKLSAKAGDVLEIEREDFGKAYTYYRLVVER